jgi:hypothetical protein
MPTHEFARHYVSENLRRTWQQWKERRAVVAFIVLMASAVGLGWIAEDARLITLGLYVAVVYVASQLFIASPWAMWDDACRKIADLEESLKPRLKLVFKENELPYLQELDLFEHDQSVTHRTCRVGIQNDSDVVIPNVRVVLESFGQVLDGEVVPAKPDQPALIGHALNVMGLDEKHGLVSVAPGDRPTAFVDVMGQWFTKENPDGDWMSPCYASGHRPILFARMTFMLGLRVEGGGTFSRASFSVGATLENRRIVMRQRGLTSFGQSGAGLTSTATP